MLASPLLQNAVYVLEQRKAPAVMRIWTMYGRLCEEFMGVVSGYYEDADVSDDPK